MKVLLSVPHLLSDPESSGLHSHPAPAPISASSGAAETLCRNGSHSVAGLRCLHPSPEKGLETPGLEFVREKDNENIIRRVCFFLLTLHLCYLAVQGAPDTYGRCDEDQGRCACLSSYLALGERPRAMTAQLVCIGSSVLPSIVSGPCRVVRVTAKDPSAEGECHTFQHPILPPSHSSGASLWCLFIYL